MNDRKHDDHPDSTRRRLLQAGAGAAALGSLPGTAIMNAEAQAPFDWKRYKGEKIEVFHVKSPRGDLLTRYHKEFEDLTGITVGSESAPEQQQRQKVVIEFNSGNTSFDVLEFAYAVQKRLLGKANWMVDVRPLVADKSVTEPAFSFANFSKGGMEWATQPDGRIDSVPFNIDPWVLYYNKELFDAKNVAYPKNFAEIVDAAARLNDPAKGVSGFVARGLKNANVPVWVSFLLGYGGGFVDRNGKLLTDTPEAIDGAKMYQTLLTKYGPPGVAGFNWNESQSLFAQGRAAMWLDGIGFAAPLEDPAKSRIVGKVGYGVMPPGPKQQVSAMYANGHGISAFSKKKMASWLYVQWASTKTNQARLLQAAAGAPVHNSAYENPEALAALKVPKAWVDCMVASSRISQPGLPIIVPVTEFRDVFGIALTNMIGGADPAAEMKKATVEFQPILDKSEKA
ncbi:MAG: sugar ABC transporter substrate-binding protein [Casimicrobiaceae bacterium]